VPRQYCGATNFTHNGVYRQANVVHVVRRPMLHSSISTCLKCSSGDDQKATRQYISKNNPIAESQPLFVGFSPRSGLKDLEAFINAVSTAKRDVFCTVFDLYDDLENALFGQPTILSCALRASRTVMHRSQASCRSDADFTSTAMLSSGLEVFSRSPQRPKG